MDAKNKIHSPAATVSHDPFELRTDPGSSSPPLPSVIAKAYFISPKLQPRDAANGTQNAL
jgi:hypothetical protein